VVIEDEPELIRFPGVVPKIPGHEGRVRWVGPELGQHTAEVLQDLAGMDADLIAGLGLQAVR
jgi:formyl-CoA transferase